MRLDLQAQHEFDQAIFKGTIGAIFSRLKGKKNSLLSFSDVMEIVTSTRNESYKGVHPILIDEIIGSEGRYNDFNNDFLPKNQFLRARWEKIAMAHFKDIELPPIQVYKLSKVYFVRDGNHRVSVARQRGNIYIDAEITEIKTDIEITAGMDRKQLKKIILNHERSCFLENTQLDKHRDVRKLVFSYPGRFDDILSHIDGHKYFLNMHQPTNFEEALLSWFDNLFEPIVWEIEKSGILFHHPKRTSGDLYIWIIRHWHYLKERFGEHIQIKDAVKSYKNSIRRNPIGSLFRSIRGIFVKKDKKKATK